MGIMPTWRQWKKYTKPSKATIIGLVLTFIALVVALYQTVSTSGITNVRQVSHGPQSPNVNGVSGNVTIQIGNSPAEPGGKPSEKK